MAAAWGCFSSLSTTSQIRSSMRFRKSSYVRKAHSASMWVYLEKRSQKIDAQKLSNNNFNFKNDFPEIIKNMCWNNYLGGFISNICHLVVTKIFVLIFSTPEIYLHLALVLEQVEITDYFNTGSFIDNLSQIWQLWATMHELMNVSPYLTNHCFASCQINIHDTHLPTYSARCLRVLDFSARYDWAIQNTSPREGRHVSR